MSDSAFTPSGLHPAKYRSLDAWRGVASFAIVLYHLADRRGVPWLQGRTLPFVDHFWLAVQLFFVISGYCLAAAVDRGVRERMKARTFLARRARRIGPPYLASVAVSFLSSFSRATLADGLASAAHGVARVSGWLWLQNLTLTQWLTLFVKFWSGHPAARPADNESLMNAPNWSLCYEEQFYVVLVAVVGLAAYLRPTITLALLTAVVVGFNSLRPNLVTGLFSDYWLQFVCGGLLYLRLCKTGSVALARTFDLSAALALALLIRHAMRDPTLSDLRYQFTNQLAVCVAFALLLLLLRSFDDRMSASAVGRALSWLGAMSYSLYLVHWPVRDLLWSFFAPTDQVNVARDGFTLGATLVFAYGFHRVFERPFMTSRPAPAKDAPSVSPV